MSPGKALPAPPLRDGNITLAATLILLRAQPEGFAVYLTERPGRVDFPSLHVFPGGKVSGSDEALAVTLRDADHPLLASCPQWPDRQLGESLALRYWLAVLREVFEEIGVLFATRKGRPLDRRDQLALTGFRDALADDSLSLEAFCRQQQLTLDLDALTYFSHWLTPAAAPRRFDTRFFVAELPVGQDVDAHAREVVAANWATPAQALDHCNSGTWQMIAPTIETLRVLARYSSIAELLAAVRLGEHLPALDEALRREGMTEFRAAAPRSP